MPAGPCHKVDIDERIVVAGGHVSGGAPDAAQTVEFFGRFPPVTENTVMVTAVEYIV